MLQFLAVTVGETWLWRRSTHDNLCFWRRPSEGSGCGMKSEAKVGVHCFQMERLLGSAFPWCVLVKPSLEDRAGWKYPKESTTWVTFSYSELFLQIEILKPRWNFRNDPFTLTRLYCKGIILHPAVYGAGLLLCFLSRSVFSCPTLARLQSYVHVDGHYSSVNTGVLGEMWSMAVCLTFCAVRIMVNH